MGLQEGRELILGDTRDSARASGAARRLAHRAPADGYTSGPRSRFLAVHVVPLDGREMTALAWAAACRAGAVQ